MSTPATTTALRALRTTKPTLRTTQAAAQRQFSMQAVSNLNRTFARSTLRTPREAIRNAFKQQTRKQTADAAPAAEAESQSAFAKLWNSPVGPKTVHFWAPIMKWGIVLAGVSDYFRPVENLSLQQNIALMCTGSIWTRWCFVIKPKNYFLATVNFFLFCNGATQTARIFRYRSSLEGDSVGNEAEKALKEEGKVIKGVVEDPKGAVKTAEAKST